MHARLAAAGAILALALGAGCARGGGAGQPPPAQPVPVPREEILIGLEQLPDRASVVQWIDPLKKREGVYKKNFGELRVYLVSMGEQRTGGYQVKIDRAARVEGAWVVDVVYLRPAPGQPVAQVITQPYEVVAVPAAERPVRFRLVEGERVRELPVTDPPPSAQPSNQPSASPRGRGNVQLISPAPQSVLKNPVTIVGRANVFEAVLWVQVEDGHDVLAEARIQASAGTGEWGDFRVTLPFQRPPTNDYGAIVFSTYSPKDGSRVEELLVPVRFR